MTAYLRVPTRFICRAISTILTCSMFVIGGAAANTFTVSPAFSGTYVWNVGIDGNTPIANPTLYLVRGQTYTFQVSGLGGFHSFYVNYSSGIGSANAYDGSGLSANGVTSDATITFDLPQDAPDILFYNCGIHASMAGPIYVAIFRDGFD